MTANPRPDELIKVFLKSILIICVAWFLSILLFGCASKKPIENTHTIERIIEYKSDSVKTSQVNKAIIDSLIIAIAKVKTAKPECDSITQATLDNVLSQLNSRKKSGDNEAGIYYDKLKKQIILWQKVAETKTEKTATNKQNTNSQIEKQVVSVPVKYIALWVKILAWIGGFSLLFIVWRIARIFI